MEQNDWSVTACVTSGGAPSSGDGDCLYNLGDFWQKSLQARLDDFRFNFLSKNNATLCMETDYTYKKNYIISKNILISIV